MVLRARLFVLQKEERQRILAKIPEGEEPKKEAGDAKTRKRKKRPHGKIGFENLAKVGWSFLLLLMGMQEWVCSLKLLFACLLLYQVIGQRWQELTPEQVEYYKKKAEEDMKRYKDQMEGKFWSLVPLFVDVEHLLTNCFTFFDKRVFGQTRWRQE